MAYPRIKKFNFSIESTYVVQAYEVGRLDKIAYKLYGYVNMYKPLAAANNIVLNQGFRTGIRKVDDALMHELLLRGFTGTELEAEYNRLMDEKRYSAYDWYSYADISYGMVSDVYTGRVLFVPTFETADSWLKQYEYLETN